MTEFQLANAPVDSLASGGEAVTPQSVLDIGSSKIAALIGMHDCHGPKVLGVGVSPANGIFAGGIVDIEQATHSIQAAVHAAELMAKLQFSNPIVVVGGMRVGWYPTKGMTVVGSGRVEGSDVARAVAAARVIPLSQEETIIDMQICQYWLDLQEGIKKPLGMAASRITVQAGLVTAASSSLENLSECLKRAGYAAASFMPQAIAASHVALSEDERSDGVCLLDIGHATTDMAIFTDGALAFLKTYSFGGAAISAAIADGLHIPHFQADEYKARLDLGNLLPCGVGKKAEAIVRDMIVTLADQLQDDISIQGLRRGLRRGIVLTGGVSAIPGIDTLVGHRLHCQTRVAKPDLAMHRSDLLASPAMVACLGACLVNQLISTAKYAY